METSVFSASYLAALSAGLTQQVLNALGRRLKEAIVGTEREQALHRCLRAATVAFVTTTSVNLPDEKDLLETIFTTFFEEPEVGKEIEPLLKGKPLDRQELNYLFQAAGYEKDTLPGIDFDRAITVFEAAFLTSAAEEQSLQAEIQAKLSLSQLNVQRNTLAAVQQLVQLVRQMSENTLEIRDGVLRGSSPEAKQPIEFRFPDTLASQPRDWEGHYLRTIVARYDVVDLTQIDEAPQSTSTAQEPVRVTDVFTTLYLNRLMRKGSKKRLRELIQEQETEHELHSGESDKEQRPIAAVEAVGAVPRLVILGQPGGGKSTLVNNLASLMARKRLGENIAPERLPGWPKQANFMPVTIILRRFAAEIPNETRKGDAGLVWQHLQSELDRMGCAEAFEQLKYHLTEHGGIIFFDGLDEVSQTDEDQRRTIITESIAAFARPLTKCKIVITCREYAYNRGDDWRLPDNAFPVVELALFKEEQIDYFVRNWYQVVGPKKGWSARTSEDEATKLSDAIKNLRHLRELAQYPLLLTLMAQVHGKDGYLPKDRADLYEKAVVLLLERWENRIVIELDGTRKIEPALVMQLGVRTEILRQALEYVAFTAHERQERQKDREQRAADIPREDLRDKLSQSLGSLDRAEKVIDYIQHRAGLLQARDNKIHTFPHRTFQEFLAATYILRQPDFDAMLCNRVKRDLSWWREVFLLAVATAKKSTPRNVSDVIDCLIPRDLNPGSVSDHTAGMVQLAAQALVETEFKGLVKGDNGKEPNRFTVTFERIQKGLALCMRLSEAVTARQRAGAGVLLAQLDDPRQSVLTVEAMPYCYVPAGEFVLGSKDGQRNEQPEETTDILDYDYWISQYPVTNAQFAAFVQNGGYDKGDYWQEARQAKIWRDGKIKGPYDSDFRDRPENFGIPWSLTNAPVVGVAWYEALAFCRWLTDHYRRLKLIDDSLIVTLPSEPEWEKAARGGLQVPVNPAPAPLPGVLAKGAVKMQRNKRSKRDYPWGDRFDDNMANSGKIDMRATSAVGCFPNGSSPYGCQEMSGNVWEWTRSLMHDYPYDPDDGREDIASEEHPRPVVRGGAFDFSAYYLRCSFRGGYGAGYWNLDIGFRVVLSP